ncbi:MAG: hypothetical protein ONB16_01100 [candidate division KSB1 bacterium]|nr:hypothetical protein [candidate division KSB1 bacterium]MDZ7341832.1 hypothetical protein [candidate division KSB1 bacterium]
MIAAFSTPKNRIRTYLCLAICGMAAFAAARIGMADNLPGILLAYVVAVSFVLAFVHSWCAARQFRLLICMSIISLVFFVILHNVFEALAHNSATGGVFQNLMQSLAVAAFFLATLICPAAFLVGVIGWVVMFMKCRRRRNFPIAP